MKKTLYSFLLISVVSLAACVDRDEVDRNPNDGVFNGGHPSRSPNHDSVTNSNATGAYVGDNTSSENTTILNEAKNGIDTDIHPENNNSLVKKDSSATRKGPRTQSK